MARSTRKQLAVGTLLAAVGGYVLGILTAPKSGKEMRRDIHKTALRTKTEGEKSLKALHSELSTLITQGKRTTKGLKDNAKTGLISALTTAQTAKDKAREILSALHEGDANAKELQKAISDVKKAAEHLKKYVTKGKTRNGKAAKAPRRQAKTTTAKKS